MLIGLNGRLRAGKDTVYEILKERQVDFWEIQKASFADKLKVSAAASLGISVPLLEELKNAEDLHYRIDDGAWRLGEVPASDFNIRTFLQRYGTEAHRDVFGQDFWIDAALPLDLDHSDRVIVVTDMRFPNEMDRVRALNGWCVYVSRPEAEAREQTHLSEQTLTGFDWTIHNSGSLQHLAHEVDLMFSYFLHSV